MDAPFTKALSALPDPEKRDLLQGFLLHLNLHMRWEVSDQEASKVCRGTALVSIIEIYHRTLEQMNDYSVGADVRRSEVSFVTLVEDLATQGGISDLVRSALISSLGGLQRLENHTSTG
jgi:hypothetical protein